MENLSDEMMPGKPISAKMRALLNKEKSEARKRIIDRGIVHFRADEEFMAALLDGADRLKTSPGTLCRRIVWEYLSSGCEYGAEPKRNELSADTTGTLIQKLELILEVLSQAVLTHPSAPSDVASIASELKRGQDEIRGELREMHAYIVGAKKKSKHGS